MTAKYDFPVPTGDELKFPIKESLQKERQILVDPMSLKELCTPLSPVVTASEAMALYPPPLQPPKPKFLSISLPNSANSSPRSASSALSKKKSEENCAESPCQATNTAKKHQQLLQELQFSRSKSCGQGRACQPSDDFDLWLTKPHSMQVGHDNGSRDSSSFYKTEAIKGSPKRNNKKHMERLDDGFKCSALCLYLPGFGKAKPVKARKEELEMESVISRTVSLEKFECGSWASSAIINEIEGDDSKSCYFDLPVELIKFSANDANSPVKAAFVFDKHLKGVLKNGNTRASGIKSENASPRHVRFSTSSSSTSSHPTSPASCITPRLRKARDEFNAFLEAQSA